MRTGAGGGCGGAGGGGAALTGLAAAFGAGLTVFLDAEGRDGLAERAGRLAAWTRFFVGLRPYVLRALTARRNFAMPGG